MNGKKSDYLTPQLNSPSEYNGAGRGAEQPEIKLQIWTQTRPPRVAKHCGQVDTDFQDVRHKELTEKIIIIEIFCLLSPNFFIGQR
jgi:hypothetical protein